MLDEEMAQLPEKFRAPLVLCYLVGKTNEEAARELGCPAGSIWWRLDRARELLRDRLHPPRRDADRGRPGHAAGRADAGGRARRAGRRTLQSAVVSTRPARRRPPRPGAGLPPGRRSHRKPCS